MVRDLTRLLGKSDFYEDLGNLEFMGPSLMSILKYCPVVDSEKVMTDMGHKMQDWSGQNRKYYENFFIKSNNGVNILNNIAHNNNGHITMDKFQRLLVQRVKAELMKGAQNHHLLLDSSTVNALNPKNTPRSYLTDGFSYIHKNNAIYFYRFKTEESIRTKIQKKFNNWYDSKEKGKLTWADGREKRKEFQNSESDETFVNFMNDSLYMSIWESPNYFFNNYSKELCSLQIGDFFGMAVILLSNGAKGLGYNQIADNLASRDYNLGGLKLIKQRTDDHRNRLVEEGRPGGIHLTYAYGKNPVEIKFLSLEDGVQYYAGPNNKNNYKNKNGRKVGFDKI